MSEMESKSIIEYTVQDALAAKLDRRFVELSSSVTCEEVLNIFKKEHIHSAPVRIPQDPHFHVVDVLDLTKALITKSNPEDLSSYRSEFFQQNLLSVCQVPPPPPFTLSQCV